MSEDEIRSGQDRGEVAGIRPLWEGDTGTLTIDSRRALVKLLRGPMVTGASAPEVWAAIDRDEQALRSRLADLFLELVLDRSNRIAFVRNVSVAEGATGHDLPQTIRAMPLTMMQSVILLHLRSVYMRSSEERVIVGEDEVRDAVSAYGRASGLDEPTFLRRFNGGWKKLKEAAILQSAETKGRFEVSAVIAVLFGVDEVRALQTEYDRLLEQVADADGDTDGDVGGSEYGQQHEHEESDSEADSSGS